MIECLEQIFIFCEAQTWVLFYVYLLAYLYQYNDQFDVVRSLLGDFITYNVNPKEDT